jgi:4-amino-4-deoxy-L-arabinose transferase-like glycosyltransferase
VWSWDKAPPGVTHDEAAHLHDARRIWDGERPIYWETAYGREPLFDYSAAPLVGLLGVKVTTGRLAAAIWGTAFVVALYAWVVQAFDPSTALLAAGLSAISFWPLATSRQILRSGTLPVMITAGMALFWRAVSQNTERHRYRNFVLTGLVFGLSFYTYMPARITWMLPVVVAIWLVVSDRPRWRKMRLGFGLMLLVEIAVAAPLLGYLWSHPELEVRVDELAAPLKAFQEGDPSRLLSRVRESILMFSHHGDTHWIYNISDSPLLPPAVALLLYLGIILALIELVRSRRPLWCVLLLWLLLGIVPALVTGIESSSLRAIGSQPAVFVLAALPLAALGRTIGRSARGKTIWLGLMLVGSVFLFLTTYRDYFKCWADNRETRVAYHSHLVAMVEYLEGEQYAGPVSLSTQYPGYYHDPYAAETLAGRAGATEGWRWYDARFALVFPDAKNALATFPALAPLDPALNHLFEPYAQLKSRIELMPDDLSPWIQVYEWEPQLSRADLPLADPLVVGDVLQYHGSEMWISEGQPGDALHLITFWEPLRSLPASEPELVIFTHLLGADNVIAQQDRLDVPPTTWRAGDLFAQLHRLQIPAHLETADHQLETGAYWRSENYPRLLVRDGGNMIGDRIKLPSLDQAETR